MEREERENGGELMVEKLKRGILVGKREGNSTPSPTWKFGSIQPDGTLIPDFNFSPLSARKLGANLWEMEPQFNHRVEKMSKNGPIFARHRSEGKGFGISKELDEAQAVKSPSKQETGGVNLRKDLAASLTRHNARVENVGQAQQPLSPASYSSSKEMAPHRSVMSPNGSLVSNSKFGESSRSLKTSTELLKVLNRIWSLEEKHVLDMSLVKTLRQELDQSKARIQELMQEKKRDKNEVGCLMKQLREYKVARKKDQEQIKNAVKSVEGKLEGELKLRRHLEKRHQKLANELSEIKSSFSNALGEIEQERKARVMLEDLCDAFARGIRDYEQEIRAMKHKTCTDQIESEGNNGLILHISEAWLDERTQMKLTDARDVSDKCSVLDKLCLEIESFLREKQSGNSGKIEDVSSKTPGESNVLAHSLESFHLNEPASAPWNVNDEDDSVGVMCRDRSLRQANETTETKAVNRKVQSRKQLLNEGSTKPSTENLETTQRSFREGKSRVTNADADLEDTKLKHGYNCMESCFDPSALAGPPSPVKKWTLEAPAMGPDTPESCSKWPKTTLKAKLMEARQERLQQSRTRTCKSLSQGD
ncbi:hypothetical protein ACS0TY_019250 [Phlomoides rotata]